LVHRRDDDLARVLVARREPVTGLPQFVDEGGERAVRPAVELVRALDHAGPGREGVRNVVPGLPRCGRGKTGKTPAEIVELARVQGFELGSKSGPVVAWLKQELVIGHGHAQAMAHVITKGATISDRHVGTTGSHRDESTELRLDGRAAR